MARGGARPGAGRKVGTTTKRTQEIAAKVIESGLAPLEIMTMAAQHLVERAQKAKDAAEKSNLLVQAANVAKDAAPYVHPRMAPKAPDDGTGAGYIVFKAGGVLNNITHGNLPRTADAARGPDEPMEAEK